MSPLRPTTTHRRVTNRHVMKVIATIVGGCLALFMVNTVRSGTQDSATGLSTQSLVILPSSDGATASPTPVATTAPVSVPTSTATPEPTPTFVPTAEPTATAAPTPTVVVIASDDQGQTPPPSISVAGAGSTTDTAEVQPAPTAEAPTSVPAPTATAVPEPTATLSPEPTSTLEPTPEPTVEATPEPTVEATPEPTATATAVPLQSPAQLEAYVLGEINQVRSNAGLGPIAIDPTISTISRDWSQQMATGGFFSHRPSDQLNAMLPAGWREWGENIASAPDIFWAQSSLEQSPGHYANMVGDFTHVGIGVYMTGQQVWVTQNFARY